MKVTTVPTGTPAAWLAIAAVDADGREAKLGAEKALALVAVCVHSDYPAEASARLGLLDAVVARGNAIIKGMSCLIVLPGGFFGYDGEPPSVEDIKRVETAVRGIQTARLPAETAIAAGLDQGEDIEDEGVWVWPPVPNPVIQIARGVTPPAGRIAHLLRGSLHAAFFTCGEFTGSPSQSNGPYFEGRLLERGAPWIADCRLLVDVAHQKIRGTVNSTSPSPRQVHERQMLAFQADAASVLTHHHPGALTAGRPRGDSQSGWILFRGGKWFDEPVLDVAWPS